MKQIWVNWFRVTLINTIFIKWINLDQICVIQMDISKNYLLIKWILQDNINLTQTQLYLIQTHEKHVRF